MEKYEEYYSKIEKTAQLRSKFYRFRILIISVLALFIVSISGFLISKGTIIHNIEVKEEFAYGDEIGMSGAKVLFGTADYEFSEYGEDNWSNQKPTNPGKYNVRVKSNGVFGIKKYSKPVTFSILPRSLTYSLLNEDITYGEDPEIKYNLTEGDTIDVDYSYKNNMEEIIIIGTVNDIKNSDGDSVINLYDVPTIETKVKFSKKPVTLVPNIELDNIYDGKGISGINEIKEGTLAYKDVIDYDLKYFKDNGHKYVEIDEIPTEVGNYACSIIKDSVKILNSNNEVTNDYYNINNRSFEKYEFNINPREIDVMTGSSRKIYDGKPITNINPEDCHVIESSKYSLVDGHRFEFNLSLNDTYTKAGEYENKLSLKVFNGNADVTKNYIINYSYGNLIIDKYSLNVNPYSYEGHSYDGTIFDYDEYVNSIHKDNNYIEVNDSKLPNGEKIVFSTTILDKDGIPQSKVKDAGTYTIKLNGINIDKSRNVDPNNYDIHYAGTSTFTIEQRKLVLSPEPFAGFKYDGLNHRDLILDGIGPTHFTFEEDTSLIANEKLYVNFYFTDENGNVTNDIKDAGNYRIYIGDAQEQSTANLANYNLDRSKYTTFTIDKRNVSVKVDVGDIDGREYGFAKIGAKLPTYISEGSVDKLANNEIATVTVSYYDQQNHKVNPRDAGSYTVKVEDFLINDDAYLANNYIWEPVPEVNFDINKRTVNVKPIDNDLNYVYGDANVSKLNDKLVFSNNSLNNALIDEEELQLYVKYQDSEGKLLDNLVHAGSYDIIYQNDFNIIGGNKDNYIVNFTPEKKINIAKRNLDIESILEDKTYDSLQTKIVFGKDVLCKNVVEGDKLNVEFKSFLNDIETPAIDAGTYEFRVSDITMDNRDDYNLNFDIGDVILDYTIEPKNINIEVSNLDPTYIYGNQIPNIEWKYTDNNNTFISNHTPSLKFEFNGKNTIGNGDVGTYVVSLNESATVIRNNEGIVVNNKNYKINFSDTSFDIKPRDIVIAPILDELSRAYNGRPTTYRKGFGNYKLVKGNLVYSDKLEVAFNYSNYDYALNADTYTLQLDPNKFKLLGGKDGTSTNPLNYNVTLDNTYNYTINKAKIEINLKTIADSVEYDGKSKDYYSLDVHEDASVITGVNGEKLKYHVYYSSFEGYTEPINAGKYIVKLDYVEGLDKALSENYEFVCKDKSFTITKKGLDVKLPTIKDFVYNGQKLSEDNSFPVIGLVPSETIAKYNVVFYESQEDMDKGFKTYAKNAGHYFFNLDLEKTILNTGDALGVNYIINFNQKPGEFNILKRNIKINLKSFDDVVYDGNSFNQLNIHFDPEGEGFANPETEYLSVIPKVMKNGQELSIDNEMLVGSYDITVKDFLYSDDLMKRNYNIIVTGTCKLNVIPKEITITPMVKHKTGINDKQDLSKNIIQQIVYGDTTYNKDDVRFRFSDSIALGHTMNFNYDLLSDLNGDIVEEIKNAGSYSISNLDIKIDKNGVDYTNNYNFIFNESHIVVDKKYIDFDLEHKEIIFDNKPHTYGDIDNTVTIDGVNGEKIKINLIPLNSKDELKQVLHADNYNFKVEYISYEDNALESNYQISDGKLSGTYYENLLTILPRSLDIKMLNYEDFIYNGEYREYPKGWGNYRYQDNTTIDHMLVGDNNFTLIPKLYDGEGRQINLSKVKDAGTYIFKIGKGCIVYNQEDLEKDYIVNCPDVQFTIYPKKISAKLTSNQPGYLTYNKKKHDYELKLNISRNDLIDGDIINLTKFNILDENGNVVDGALNAGKYKYHYVDHDNKNYILDVPDLEFEINRAILEVEIDNIKNIVYDNSSKSKDDLVLKYHPHGLLDGDEFNPLFRILKDGTEVKAIKNAGAYEIGIDPLANPNYDVKVLNNQFEITPKDVQIKFKDFIKEYDSLNITSLTNEQLIPLILNSVDEIYPDDRKELVFDYEIVNLDNKNVTKVDAGYPLIIKGVTHNNYNFTIENPELNIFVNQKTITLQLLKNSKIFDYDGKVVGIKDFDATFKHLRPHDIYKDDTFTYELEYRDAKTKEVVNPYTIKDSGKYTINIKEGSIKFDDLSNENNYIVNIGESETNVIINPREISLKPHDISKIYDGQPLKYGDKIIDYLDGSNHLLDGLHFSEIVFNQNYPGTYVVKSNDVMIKDLKIVDANGNEVEQSSINKQEGLVNKYRNYILDVEGHENQGFFEIKKRPITIVGLGFEKAITYDGNYHKSERFEVLPGGDNSGLVKGHEVRLKENVPQGKSAKYVGNRKHNRVYNNRLTFEIFDQDGQDVIANYDLNFSCDTDASLLKIKQRNLELTIYRDKLTGASQLVRGKEYDVSGLVAGETINVRLAKDPEIPYLRYVIVKIYDQDGVEVTDCYKINKTITKKDSSKGGPINE